MAEHICVAFPTIMDGLVLRWYLSVDAWHGDGEIASASRNCFIAHEGCPAEIRRLADQAHSYLTVRYAASLRPGLDVSRWVTHRAEMFSQELHPVPATNSATSVRNDLKGEG